MTDIAFAPASARGSSLSRKTRELLRSRKAWFAAALAFLAVGAALNPSWLLLAGAAPLLIKLLPCAAMCALGLCARGAGCASDVARPHGSSPTSARSADLSSASWRARPFAGRSQGT